MITCQPGDPIWIREGVFIANEVCNTGLPIGTTLKRPQRGIFLERKVINSRIYIKNYIDSVGERFVEESVVLELK
jgi:hypothetical protein